MNDRNGVKMKVGTEVEIVSPGSMFQGNKGSIKLFDRVRGVAAGHVALVALPCGDVRFRDSELSVVAKKA